MERGEKRLSNEAKIAQNWASAVEIWSSKVCAAFKQFCNAHYLFVFVIDVTYPKAAQDMDPEVLFTALDMMDRFIACRKTEPQEMELIVSACLFIAAK